MGAAQQLNLTFEKKPLFNSKLVNFKNYSKFARSKEFDAHWDQFMVDYKSEFTKYQLDALRVVREYAVVNPGVCNASYRELEEASQAKYGYMIKRWTFRRALDKAEELGALVKYEGMRLKDGHGSRTANVVIFNRIEEIKMYQIAKKTQEEREIARLLEEEYNKASVMNNYAANARKWQQEKTEREERKARVAQRQERTQKEQEEASKQQTLFSKVLAALKAKKLDTSNISEYMGILYGSIKKTTAADPQLSKARAEQIALQQFYVMCNTPDKDILKNRAAYLSHLLRSKLLSIVEGYTTKDINKKRAKNAHKKVGVVPAWFNQDEQARAEQAAQNEAAMNTPENQARIAALKARMRQD